MYITNTDALIIVDVQNDFCPGGALAVPEGDQVVAPINRIAPLFHTIVTSQDWHPADHCSFGTQGGIWPPHCVAGSPGAELRSDLQIGPAVKAVRKAATREQDAYSAFDGTGLTDRLNHKGITRVFITGLATDYCVKATALDASKAGFPVVVLEDAIRAVNVHPEDGPQALQEMQAAGAKICQTSELTG